MTASVELRSVTKVFRNVDTEIVANDRVSLTARPGEIHAIVGENGAGKTTLMNILYGLLQPDEGEILIGGSSVKIANPAAAISLGIGMVHQHFMLVPSFSVAENVVLGYEPGRGPFVSREEIYKTVERLCADHNLNVDPRQITNDCSVSVKQVVEILKVLYRGARIIILDEPTAVLTPQESEDLFRALRSLAERGACILFISHRLREVIRLADTVTVMRNGRSVATLRASDSSESELASLMVGKEVLEQEFSPAPMVGDVILGVRNLVCRDSRGVPVVNGVSFEVRAGEIVGIAGMARNGQEELAEALMGLRQIESGRILIKGQDVTGRSTRYLRNLGVGHIPDDRYVDGVAKQASVTRNLIMGRHDVPPLSRLSWFNMKEVRQYSQSLIERFDVVASDPNAPIISLSGGNVQKAVVARELTNSTHLLICEQPTRGVDIASSSFIHRQLMDRRDEGAGILLISMDLAEVLKLATRVLIMCKGKIVGEVRPWETNEAEIGLMMAGLTGGK